jgi:hypothetical protein
MSIGGTIARGLLGAAAGYGNYLTQTGLAQQKQKDDDALVLREQALAKYRSDLEVDQQKQMTPIINERTAFTAEQNRVSNALELSQRATAKAAESEAEEKRDIAKENREFNIWKKKNDISLSTEKAKAAYQSGLDIQKDLKTQGYKVIGSTIDADTGTEVYTLQDASGNITNYDSGVVLQQKQTTDPFTGKVSTPAPPKRTTVQGFRDSGGTPSPPATPSGRKTLSPDDYNVMINDAAARAARGDPAWKGLDAAGIRKKLGDLARAKGYDLPSIR